VRLGFFRLAIAPFLICQLLLPATAEEANADSILADVRGMSLMKEAKYKEAIAAFDEAIQADASNWTAYVHRSKAYVKEGKYEEALSSADRAIKLQPKKATCYVSRAQALMKMSQTSNALAELNKAIMFDPQSGEAYYWRAKVWAQLGNLDRSLKDRASAAHYGYVPAPGD